jgi:ankyrin repeat protein
VNAKSAEGWTPQHLAAEEGHKDLGESLIDEGADVDARDAEDWTPLHVAFIS